MTRAFDPTFGPYFDRVHRLRGGKILLLSVTVLVRLTFGLRPVDLCAQWPGKPHFAKDFRSS